jgi:hypothetical protein
MQILAGLRGNRGCHVIYRVDRGFLN